MSPSKPKAPKKSSSPRSRKLTSEDSAPRIERLEKMLDLVLQASLRGRLLPGERRSIKRHLEQRKAEQRKRQQRRKKEQGPRCPACSLPIPSEEAERCPHCSVLLDVIRKNKRGRQ